MTEYMVTLSDRDIIRLTLDTEAVARGSWDMLTSADRACVAFGMIPKPLHDALENQLGAAFDRLVEEKTGKTPAYFDKFVTGLGLGRCTEMADQRKEFVRSMTKAVCTNIYGVASRAGQMVV